MLWEESTLRYCHILFPYPVVCGRMTAKTCSWRIRRTLLWPMLCEDPLQRYCYLLLSYPVVCGRMTARTSSWRIRRTLLRPMLCEDPLQRYCYILFPYPAVCERMTARISSWMAERTLLWPMLCLLQSPTVTTIRVHTSGRLSPVFTAPKHVVILILTLGKPCFMAVD